MGIKGSSTTAVFFDNVTVPVENVLGEIGRGHIIAFNILNLGRLKLGPFAVGGAKEVLAQSLQYAKERKAFGKSIAEFGMIQHKLAEMAVRIYAAETMSYRVTGDRFRIVWSPDESLLKATEEFAAECSLRQGLRLRDARLRCRRRRADSRRLWLPPGLRGRARLSRLAHQPHLRRHERNQSPARDRHAAEARATRSAALVAAVKQLQDELLSGNPLTSYPTQESRIVRPGRRLSAILTRSSRTSRKYLASITDVLMYAYAIESVHLRNPEAE